MKKIRCVIEGTAPLLMHSAAGMEQQKPTRNPAKQYNHAEDAEKVAYRDEKGNLIVPSRCVKASILNGSSWIKFGKRAAKPILAGCTRIEPYEIPLTDLKGKVLRNYEIDLRPVVINRNRIIRARPRIPGWKLSFDIIYNDEIIADTELIKHIITEAGMRAGLLDNRPQKYGDNGTFRVSEWGGNIN